MPVIRHVATPLEPVRVPVMQHRWESVAFLHWSYPVDEVQRHLPRGLEVEPWDAAAWAIECREDLVAAAGLTPPEGEPVVHWSPGVDVRIGRPRMMRGR